MVIDGSSAAKGSKTSWRVHYRAKISYACAVRAGDEGMILPFLGAVAPCHLTRAGIVVNLLITLAAVPKSQNSATRNYMEGMV